MEVNILSERELVYRSSDTPTIEKKVEIPVEREVSYYKSSDPKADCDNFVDMYEEDYILELEVGLDIPKMSKCPAKYFLVENLFGELEDSYLKEEALKNLGIIVLTQKEYDNLDIIDPTILYFILDDIEE